MTGLFNGASGLAIGAGLASALGLYSGCAGLSAEVSGVAYPAFTQVVFDGNNDYTSRTAAFTGAPADSSVMTFAAMIQMGGVDGALYRLVAFGDAAGALSTDMQVQLDRNSANKIVVTLRQGATTVYTGTSTGTLTTVDGEVRLMVSIDLTSGVAHCYKDNTDLVLPGATGAAFGLSLVQRPRFMSSLSGTALAPATVRYFYFDNSYIDLSVLGNRDKFLTTGIGNTGENVSGSTPLVMLYGAASDWNAGTNFGTGGNFTMTGAVV